MLSSFIRLAHAYHRSKCFEKRQVLFRAVAEELGSSYHKLDSFGSSRDEIAEAKFYDVYYGNRV